MSETNSNLDLPALSTDESASSMTDNSTSMNESNRLSSQKNFTTAPVPPPQFMDQSFFYSLGQLSADNPLLFMQQQNTGFADQFLKENGESSNNQSRMNVGDSTSTLAQSIASNMESFQAAITTSVGEQPLSFWTGLNNFISNVTHNNIFPTFPNIARSFSEYLSNHPVPFLSSLSNAPTDSPIASPMTSSSMDFDPMMQLKQQFAQSSTGLQIRVLGVPQTGAKSRVETQIKLCIQLVTDGGDKAQWWSHIKLPENMVTKEKTKKSYSDRNTSTDNGLPENPEKMLFLQARVLCASDPSKKVLTCMGCVQRERKRSQRRKENKLHQLQLNNEESEDLEDENQSLASDEERILLFNCAEVVDFSAGDTILPTRITCYCRHHNERLGFCIYFEMLDYTGKKVAEGISPPIMITDDHKSNKLKAGLKRRRTSENEPSHPALPPPMEYGGIPALNWIKSFQFGNNATAKTENQDHQYALQSSASSTASADDSLKSVFRNMLAPTVQATSYSPPPMMKRLIPNEAPASGGIEITILGTDFRPGMTVMFGDTPASNIQYWSPNTLICTLPPASQPGAVVVSFRDSPPATNKNDIMVFTYLVETDRALMELALQVVGMKMTGVVEDARKIAMRIVQGNGSGNGQNFADKLETKSQSPSNNMS